MDVAEDLRLRYGLERQPTQDEVDEWYRATTNLIAEGEPEAKAGDVAAKYVLPGYRTHIFKSEADNIEALLKELAKK